MTTDQATRATPSGDVPAMADMRDHVEPVPRRIRALLGGEVVLDTTRALYAWDTVKYPHYLVPVGDVTPGALVDEGRDQRLRRGAVRLHGLRLGGHEVASVARVYADDAGPVAGHVRFDWESLDWFEEDQPVFVHPRNPYTRVDALRSSRHIVVALDGHVLAESTAPVLVFETGLPTRYYFDRRDVDLTVLSRTSTETACPYKGSTSDYRTATVGGRPEVDVAWSYRQPFPEVQAIAGLVAFYNDRVDITVGGVELTAGDDASRVAG